MGVIQGIKAREILDSRGNPTVSVMIKVDGAIAEASVPSGASTGIYEAIELRDGDKSRYHGKGVLQAVENVNVELATALIGNTHTQESLDRLMISLDGTENKARLGANAILGVSMAFAKASAIAQNQELYKYLQEISNTPEVSLPQPMFNIINGGKHADSGLEIQEFMLGPVNFGSFKEKVRVGAEIFHTLKDILHNMGHKTSVGDEGGFAPNLASNDQALEVILQSIEKAGYNSNDVKIGLDAAASSFYADGAYKVKVGGVEKALTREELLQWYVDIVAKYPIISIEDGLEEEDWAGFSQMAQMLGDKIKIVGDDLLVTNISKIKTAIEHKAVNSVLIKLNQIGSVTETIDAINMTKQEGWLPFVSHRSGETEDTFIADLSVGLGCDFIKSGSLSRGERVSKYNRIMQIEEQLK